MKILIVGAGLIGSIYGWALGAGGHEVVHLVRKGRSERYSQGLKLDLLDKRPGKPQKFRGVYRLTVVESTLDAADAELLIVPGHHFALDEVLTEVVPQVPGATVLFLTQNWVGTEAIDAALSPSRSVFGDAKAGGSWEDGVLVGALHSLDVGAASPSGAEALARVVQVLGQARIPAPVHRDMIGYLWVQFASTAALWPALVEAGSFPAVLNDRRAGYRALDSMLECLALVEKRGINLSEYPEMNLYRSKSRFLRFLALGSLKFAFTWSEFMKRTSAHALGDKAEIAAFYRDIRKTAQELDHPMPVFDSYAASIERFTRDGLHSAG